MEVHSSKLLRPGHGLVALGLVALIAAVVAVGSNRPEPAADAPAPEAAARLVTGQPLSGLRAALAADDVAIDGVRRYAPYVAQGSAKSKEIALTFDDGPGATTPALLRYLVKERVPATFFLVGHAVAAHADIVRAEVDAGFSLGTHTENHASLGGKPASEQAREILTAADRITRISRHAVRLFRPPYGSFDARTLHVLRARADADGAVERRHEGLRGDDAFAPSSARRWRARARVGSCCFTTARGRGRTRWRRCTRSSPRCASAATASSACPSCCAAIRRRTTSRRLAACRAELAPYGVAA